MREHPDYRNTLEGLNEMFPHKEILCIKDVVQYTGRSHNTVKKYYMPKTTRINKRTLARLLCG